MVSDKIEVTVTSWKKGGWKTNDAYDCRMAPSGSVNPDPGPVQAQVVRTTTVCWKVGGSVTASADLKKGLLAKLFAQHSVSVEFNGEFERCVERTDSLTANVPSNQCYRNSGRFISKDAIATGVRTFSEAETRWSCVANGVVHVTYTRCNTLDPIIGEVDKLAEEMFQRAPPTPECGGPSPADPQYDGKFMEKCSANMAGCGNSTQPYCCGIASGG